MALGKNSNCADDESLMLIKAGNGKRLLPMKVSLWRADRGC